MIDIDPLKKVEITDPEYFQRLPIEPVKYIEHPFQKFLDYAVESLNTVSGAQLASDQIINRYIAGEASLEDVMFAQNRASIQTNLAVTAINNALSAFKEIQQMPL